MSGYDDMDDAEIQEMRDVLPHPGPRTVYRKGRERDTEAARLKALGWTLEEICEQLALGDDPRRAAAAIKRALGTMFRFAKDEHREMELQSYDELEAILWRQIRKRHVLVDRGNVVLGINGEIVEDDRFILETLDRIMKIKERRAKLLGLDAPARSEVITIDTVDAEIARLESELQAARLD